MEHNELKPCPFCGGKAKIINTSNGCETGYFTSHYEIGCVECRISFRGTSCIEMKDGVPFVSVDGYKEIVEKWNRRANDGTR